MELLTKKKFEEITKNYYRQKARFEGIKPGDLVWEVEFDYHPAIVKNVNVDERYVDVIDVSDRNKNKKYYGFITESEFIQEFPHNPESVKNCIKESYKEYSDVINSVLEKKVK